MPSRSLPTATAGTIGHRAPVARQLTLGSNASFAGDRGRASLIVMSSSPTSLRFSGFGGIAFQGSRNSAVERHFRSKATLSPNGATAAFASGQDGAWQPRSLERSPAHRRKSRSVTVIRSAVLELRLSREAKSLSLVLAFSEAATAERGRPFTESGPRSAISRGNQPAAVARVPERRVRPSRRAVNGVPPDVERPATADGGLRETRRLASRRGLPPSDVRRGRRAGPAADGQRVRGGSAQ